MKLSELSELSEDYIAEMPVKLGLIPIYFGSSGSNCFWTYSYRKIGHKFIEYIPKYGDE